MKKYIIALFMLLSACFGEATDRGTVVEATCWKYECRALLSDGRRVTVKELAVRSDEVCRYDSFYVGWFICR